MEFSEEDRADICSNYCKDPKSPTINGFLLTSLYSLGLYRMKYIPNISIQYLIINCLNVTWNKRGFFHLLLPGDCWGKWCCLVLGRSSSAPRALVSHSGFQQEHLSYTLLSSSTRLHQVFLVMKVKGQQFHSAKKLERSNSDYYAIV